MGAYIVFDGVMSIVGCFRHGNLRWSEGILFLIWGVIQLIASIFIWFAPGLGAGTLMALFGVWAMLTGMFLLVGAFTKDGSLMSPWIQGVVGVLGILAGIYPVVEPGCGALVTIWAIGTSAIA